MRELHAMLRKHTALTLPPGSTVYGLDTYSELARRAIRRRTPQVLSPLGRLLENAVCFVAGTIVGRTLVHAQGLYADGWAGKTLLYMLPSGCRSVVIQGSVPEWAVQLRGQSLQVECNGRRLGRYPVAAGEFSIQIEVPYDLANEALRFRIVAQRSFVPSFRGDRRRLAYRLASFAAHCGKAR